MTKSENKPRYIVYVLLTILIAVIIFSSYKVYTIQKGYSDEKENYDSIAAQYTSSAVPVEITEPDSSDDSIDINKVKPTIQTMKNVDFEKLRTEVNPEIIAWITCPDTVIDYPIVQGKDNEHYLYYSVDGKYSGSGTLFLEAQNYSDFSDKNSIIHGHHMQSGAMFATLDRWQNQEYYEAHPYFTLNTVYSGDYQVEVVAAFNTDADTEPYRYEFYGDDEFQEWLNFMASQSRIKSRTEMDITGRYILMSTCAYDGGPERRSVVLGRLVPMA